MSNIEYKTDYKNILVFTHNDADGIFGAYIIKHFFDNNLENESWDNNVKVYCCSYKRTYNLAWFKEKTEEFINEYDGKNIKVYMIDYAIQPNEDMVKFNNWCSFKHIDFEWIDHHITAIENLEHYNLPGFRNDKACGCANTWCYLMEEFQKIEKCPRVINLVNDFDIWNKNSKFNWDEEIFPLIYYIDSISSNYDDINDNKSELITVLKDLFENEDSLQNYINIGKFIKKFVDAQNFKNSKKIYEITWNGYDSLVLNTITPGTMQFESHPKYGQTDLMITWSYDGDSYFYGVYTTKPNIDVGELCQMYFKGGGHKGCGGGQSKEFLIKNDN